MPAPEPQISIPMLEKDADSTGGTPTAESDAAPPHQPTETQPLDEEDVKPTTKERGNDELVGTVQLAAVKLSQTLENVFDATSKRTICAFGPKSSFFYYGGDEEISWAHCHDKADYPYTVSGISVSSWDMKTPYHVALSPHGAGYFAYVSYQQGLMWRFIDIHASTRPKNRKAREQFDATVEAYAKLKRWLHRNVKSVEDIMRTRVVFGPGARFMAWRIADGVRISNDLPVSLRLELETRRSAAGMVVLPSLVTFGRGNAWAALWSDGSHSVDLDKKFPRLEKVFKENPAARFLYIALNNTASSEEYFTRFRATTIEEAYRMSPTPRAIAEKYWQIQTLRWSSSLGIEMALTSIAQGTQSQTLIIPTHAIEAIASEPASRMQTALDLMEEGVELSFEITTRSISASKVAVVTGGVTTTVALCSVM